MPQLAAKVTVAQVLQLATRSIAPRNCIILSMSASLTSPKPHQNAANLRVKTAPAMNGHGRLFLQKPRILCRQLHSQGAFTTLYKTISLQKSAAWPN